MCEDIILPHSRVMEHILHTCSGNPFSCAAFCAKCAKPYPGKVELNRHQEEQGCTNILDLENDETFHFVVRHITGKRTYGPWRVLGNKGSMWDTLNLTFLARESKADWEIHSFVRLPATEIACLAIKVKAL